MSRESPFPGMVEHVMHEGHAAWYPVTGHLKFNRGLYLHQENAQVAFPFIREKRVCVQAGGAIGLWPRFLARHFERVYTFEPLNVSFKCLVLNAPSENVFAFNAALGRRSSFASLLYPDRPGQSRIHGPGPIPVMRLDDLGLERLDFLCLDVESFELPIIQGAWRTLQRCHPTIMLECSGPLPKDGRTDNYADVCNALVGWEQRARIKADVVLEWTGTKAHPPYLGKPPLVPTQPPYRGEDEVEQGTEADRSAAGNPQR